MIESWRRDFKDDTDRVDESFEFNQIEADRKSGAASALAGRAAGSQPSSAERRATAAAALEQEHPFPMVSGEVPAERVPLIGLEHGDSGGTAIRKYLGFLFQKPIADTWYYDPHTQGGW